MEFRVPTQDLEDLFPDQQETPAGHTLMDPKLFEMPEALVAPLSSSSREPTPVLQPFVHPSEQPVRRPTKKQRQRRNQYEKKMKTPEKRKVEIERLERLMESHRELANPSIPHLCDLQRQILRVKEMEKN